MAHAFTFLRRYFFWSGRLTKVALSTLLWVWLFGFLLFEWRISILSPSALSSSFIPVDALVVFTGSSGRVQTGLQLLKQHYAPRLLISGVESHRRVVLTAEELDLPITLGYGAKNTPDNVRQTAEWLQQHQAKTALLVTADYHMPRSLLLLRTSSPLVHFFAYPLETRWEKRLSYSFLEYHKYIVSWFFSILNRRFLS